MISGVPVQNTRRSAGGLRAARRRTASIRRLRGSSPRGAGVSEVVVDRVNSSPVERRVRRPNRRRPGTEPQRRPPRRARGPSASDPDLDSRRGGGRLRRSDPPGGGDGVALAGHRPGVGPAAGARARACASRRSSWPIGSAAAQTSALRSTTSRSWPTSAAPPPLPTLQAGSGAMRSTSKAACRCWARPRSPRRTSATSSAGWPTTGRCPSAPAWSPNSSSAARSSSSWRRRTSARAGGCSPRAFTCPTRWPARSAR